jgi:hypothetical protein
MGDFLAVCLEVLIPQANYQVPVDGQLITNNPTRVGSDAPF